MKNSTFGLLLQCLREKRKLSLRELAQIAEVDHAYIYRLETGEKYSPSEEVLSKLIRALKPDKRESSLLHYLAKQPETDSALVKHTFEDQSVSFDVFKIAANAAFRGSERPEPAKLIQRVQKMLTMLDEKDTNG